MSVSPPVNVVNTPGTSPHIFHVFPSFGIGGVPLRMSRVLAHLGARCRHTILALDNDFAAAERLGPDVAARLMPLPPSAGNLVVNLCRHRRVLRNERPDLLATYNWGSIEWAMANRFFPLCRHVHLEAGFGAEEASRQLFRRVVARRLSLARCSKIVVPSLTLQKIARDVWRLPQSMLIYIPNGIDVDRFAPAPRRPLEDPSRPVMVGTVAPLRPEKNVGRLIRAFSRMQQAPASLLTIVGDGSQRAALGALARSLNVADRVRFAGSVAEPERLLATFDVFALSSDTEQMPNAVLEAMAAGLPVASVDVGDVMVMVAPENREFIVPRDDTDALAAAIARLASDPERRHRIGEGNRAFVASQFGQDKMFRAYEKLFLTP